MRILTFILLFIASFGAYAQFSPVKRAIENLNDGDAIKAKELLVRALERDSLDPEVKYGLSILYNSSDYLSSNLDSSYYYILGARLNYANLDQKEKEKLEKSGIDSLLLETQKMSIDSQAFFLAKKENSVNAYKSFRSRFPSAFQVSESSRLERKVAFEISEQENTYASYEDYIAKYPDSEYFEEAMSRYELLLFKEKTKDKSLDSFIKFLEIRPESPYRPQTEKEVFEIITAGNRLVDFKQFFSISKSKKIRQYASGIIYHVLKEDDLLDLMQEDWWTDSLRKEDAYIEKALYPLVDDKGYFFIDETGLRISVSYPSIDSDYICNPPMSSFVSFSDADNKIILSASSQEIYKGSADEVKDLGYGIIKLIKDGKAGYTLKGGEGATPFLYEDIKMVAGAFLGTKINGRWGLISFTGKPIVSNQYDDIKIINNSILLFQNEKIAVSSVHALKKGADGKKINLIFVYDEYEEWSDKKLWVRSGSSEALINENSSFDIELSDHEIIPYEGYYVLYGSKNTLLNDQFDTILEGWSEIKISEGFISIKKEEKYSLLKKPEGKIQQYDSVTLWGGQFATAVNNGIRYLIPFSNERFAIKNESSVKLLSGEYMDYLCLKLEGVSRVIDKHGSAALTGEFDEIKSLGKEYLVVKDKDKELLYSNDGNQLLDDEYDAFGGYENGGISVLADGKLGYFNLNDSIWIEPSYSRKVVRAGKNYFIVNSGDGNYIISENEEDVPKATFNKITSWNDSMFLVNENNQFLLYNAKNQTVVSNPFKEVNQKYFETTSALVKNQDGLVGIIDPTFGEVVPTGFNYIELTGELWRAERYFKESDLYIISFFTKSGKRIYSSALKPEQYDLLICER